MMQWKNKIVLITGGTGSFGKFFASYLLKKHYPPIVRIFSRDEFKQYEMQKEFSRHIKHLRFLLGDVRDKERLKRAMNGVDIVIHAAALKQVPLGEYNPFEPIKTNILGTRNVIGAVLDVGVKKALLISSDKACYPVNLYGATKFCSEKLFIQSNVYSGKRKGVFSVVRYGNVLGSRGSVIPMFYKQKEKGVLTITDVGMTRFWITLDQACKLVDMCLARMKGGEIFVPKLPSVKIVDLANSIAPEAKIKYVGIRPGEKIHEVLITEEESRRSKEYGHYYVISPQFPFWQDFLPKEKGRPKKSFTYKSNSNRKWLTKNKLKAFLKSFIQKDS